MGRPRKKGKRLPTLEKIAEDKHTRWKRLTVQEWYGEKKRTLKSHPKQLSGFTAGNRLCQFAGSLCVTQRGSSKPRRYYAPTFHISAEQIIEWFVRRWQVEVTFHEVRTHLGVETQRQWADLSILRITPALLGLFSIVTLLANLHAQKQKLPVQQAAWYTKKLPTFSDALRIVKQTLFSQRYFPDFAVL